MIAVLLLPSTVLAVLFAEQFKKWTARRLTSRGVLRARHSYRRSAA